MKVFIIDSKIGKEEIKREPHGENFMKRVLFSGVAGGRIKALDLGNGKVAVPVPIKLLKKNG